MSQGWLLNGTQEQRDEWAEMCLRKRIDYLHVKQTRQAVEIECRVDPGHQLTDLAYQEVQNLFSRLGWRTGGLGMGHRDNASQFRANLPPSTSVEELVRDVQEILAYDRSPRRRAELAAGEALVEGMALALDSTGLWESHDLHDRVYVMEMRGRPGRCLVFKHLHPVLVDLPLDSFRVLADVDV